MREKTLELPLIFGGHRDHRNREIGVEAQNPGVRQILAGRRGASLPADDGERACLTGSLQKSAEVRKNESEVLFRLAFHLDEGDRKSTRLNSSHPSISYAVFC